MINEFEWNDLPEHPACVFASMRRSGKTHLLNHVLYNMNKNPKFTWDCVFVFSATSIVQDSFKYVPKSFHWKQLENDVINSMLDKQQEVIDKWRKDGEPKERQPPRILVILDDVIGDRKLYYAPPIIRIFTEGRHSRVTIFLLSQKLTGAVPPKIRENADIMVFFRQPSYDYRRDIVNNYLVMQQDKKVAYEYLDKVWDKPYKALIIYVSKSQHCRSLDEFCFSYLAPDKDPPKFKLSHPMFWKKNEKVQPYVKLKEN
jgi:hypothetical protein